MAGFLVSTEGLDGPPSLVSTPEMGAFRIAMMQLGIEVGLERRHALVEGLAHLDAEELIENGAVDVLDETVG